MITLCSIKGIAYQVNDSLLAGNQSDKLSSGYLVNILAQCSAKSFAQQPAKTLVDVSAKIYANQSGEYFLGQSAKHFANLKRGEFTPFAKGDFSHVSKEANYPHWQDLSGVTTQGRIEFCESIKGKIIEFCQSIKKERIEFLQSIKKGSYLATQFCQFFGSMPRDCNSLRSILLIQVANVASPSFFISVSSCSLNSGVNLIWYCGDLFSFPVDMVITLIYYTLHGNDHVTIIYANKAMPRSASTLTGHLITTDNETIEVTMSKHNTPVTGRTSLTPNQSYRWLFLALNRSDYTAKPCRIAVTAPNENSARLMLVRDYMLIFAGRLPVQEVAHA